MNSHKLTRCARRLAAGVLLATVIWAPQSNAQVSEAQDSRAQDFSKTDPSGAERAQATISRDGAASDAVAKKFMIAAANPLATQAGEGILARGGSAMDAAIAAQMVLNLVEPQSSGIGGGAFILDFNAATRKLNSWDGREKAPAAATPNLFLDNRGEFIGWATAFASGRATGVPGLLRTLEDAHRASGKLSWHKLFMPAIELAETGFEVSPRLADLLARFEGSLADFEDTKAYFFRDGAPLKAGMVLKNPRFAQTLRTIAEHGAAPLYSGALATELTARIERAVTEVTETQQKTGLSEYAGMTLEDLSAYSPKQRAPVCGYYRKYKVCSMAPPSSGGITVVQILSMVEPYDMAALGPDNPQALHLFAEAQRRAFADRNFYLADPDFIEVPQAQLLNTQYLAGRAQTINPKKVTAQTIKPGTFIGLEKPVLPLPRRPEGENTTHLSVIDKRGNAVSMTSTIETAFGSRLMIGGFLLNNQLTDFEFNPEKDGKAVANAPGPGKKPLSSMSPTIVFDAYGKPYMLIGSPGGKRIIGYTAKTIIAHIDWGLSIQEAIDYPHIINTNGTTDLEDDPRMTRHADALKAMGHDIRTMPMESGLHGIVIAADATGKRQLRGGADPRREGVAAGR